MFLQEFAMESTKAGQAGLNLDVDYSFTFSCPPEMQMARLFTQQGQIYHQRDRKSQREAHQHQWGGGGRWG